MGRSFLSVRQGVRDLSERWTRATRDLRAGDQASAERLAAAAKQHSSEAFYGCDDPLEAAVFSALVEIARYRAERCREENAHGGGEPGVDP